MVLIGLVGTASRQQAKQVDHVKVEIGESRCWLFFLQERIVIVVIHMINTLIALDPSIH
jgi:Zn finger protein HypA/HybF involved in hydrogenase expression